MNPQQQQQMMMMQQAMAQGGQMMNAERRFKEGAEVYCRLATGWEAASVCKNDNPRAAYQLKVSSTGELVYAPMDDDLFVRTSMPSEQEQEEMQGKIEQMKQQQAMMQERMKQQQAMMQQQMTGTALDKGATVPDGPLAEEQILLVRMIHEHQRLAQDRAARSVMTAKQIKNVEKAKAKAQQEKDEGRAMNIIQKAMMEIMRTLSPEQQQQVAQTAQQEMMQVQEKILKPQEETWLSHLTDEQRTVWENTQKVASQAEPHMRQQLTRKGQLKVGKMLSQEQQEKMAADMKANREKFMSEFVAGEQEKQAAQDAEEEDAAAQMLEQMAMGC